jgi:hypothetical protein
MNAAKNAAMAAIQNRLPIHFLPIFGPYRTAPYASAYRAAQTT